MDGEFGLRRLERRRTLHVGRVSDVHDLVGVLSERQSQREIRLHRGGDAGLQAKTISQVRSYVVFAAAHVDFALVRFAKGNNAGIEPVNDCA